MVAGDICAAPVNPVVAAELVEAEVLLGIWNGFSPEPLEGLDDEFDEVSELMAFSADDAAPRANNIGRTPTIAATGGLLQPKYQQAPCHVEKANKTWVLCEVDAAPSRQLMPPAAEISAHLTCPGRCAALLRCAADPGSILFTANGSRLCGAA
jgi:hypothetical protein